MPIFDYSCKACGYTFDVLQKLGAEPLLDCPECGEAALKKLLSAPAFHLKGKGWRKSDDSPKKPNVRPKFGHTLDSAVPHGEHAHDGPAPKKTRLGKHTEHGHKHDHGHDHGHSHSHGSGGGMEKIVRQHVHSHDSHHGHSHGEKSGGHSHGSKSDGHGHSHGHSGHKHD